MTTLVRKTGLAERTVHRAIKQLTGLGELEVRYNAGPGLCNLYQVRMTPVPQTPPSERHPRQTDGGVRDAGVSQRHPTPVREAPLPPSERHPEPSIEPSMNRQEPIPVEQARPIDDITHVFRTWQEATRKHRAQLDPKRRRRIKAALSQYPLQDVLDAVQGWQHSPHHCGQNNTGTVYNDLDLLLRDAEHLERFRDLWRDGPTPVVSKQTAQAIRTSVAMRTRRQAREAEEVNHDRGRMGGPGGPTQRGLPPTAD